MRPHEPSDPTRPDGDESENGALRWGRAADAEADDDADVALDLTETGRWGRADDPTEPTEPTEPRRWGRRRRRARSR